MTYYYHWQNRLSLGNNYLWAVKRDLNDEKRRENLKHLPPSAMPFPRLTFTHIIPNSSTSSERCRGMDNRGCGQSITAPPSSHFLPCSHMSPSHGLQLHSRYIHLLQCGVLHGCNMNTCSNMVSAQASGKS